MSYVYGIHAVDSLLRHNPRSVRQLWVQEGRDDKRITTLVELARNQGIAVAVAPRAALDERVSARHQGAIADVEEATAGAGGDSANLWSEADLMAYVGAKSEPILLLVLDGVTDPHNLGACLRSADAAGVDAVIVPRDRSAGLTPVVRKVACGAAEAVPFVRVTNLTRTLQAVKECGVWVYGTDGSAENSLYDSELTASMALVLGSEGQGMRRLTREQCDFLVNLPMAGTVSSLNVSVATGICLFEIARQRR